MRTKSAKPVIVLSPYSFSVSKLPKENFNWVYLGEDVVRSSEIESIIPGNGGKASFTKKLRDNMLELNEPFINYIGDLSYLNDSTQWWLGDLSEKNVFISKSYLHICYIKTCLDIINEDIQDKSPIVFFVENIYVRDDLISNLFEMKDVKAVRLDSPAERVKLKFRDLTKFFKSKSYFLFSNIYRILISKYLIGSKKLNIKPNTQNILVFSWITRDPFDDKGEYQDIYYGNLYGAAKKYLDRQIFIIPYPLGTVSYKDIAAKISKSDESFLIPWDILDISDILGSLFKSVKGVTLEKNYPNFQGMKVSRVLFQTVKNEWLDKRFPTNLLFYRLIEKLKEQDIGVSRFIYLFENHTWEKAFVMAFREYYPETILIGYQHTTIPTTMLNFFFSEKESSIIPLPDKILTNGEYPFELLKSRGYPESILEIGGAIRFEDIIAQAPEKDEREVGGVPRILVTPSIGMMESIELIRKAHDAFKDSQFQIFIKCHPAMPYHYLSRFLGFDMPRNFKITSAPMRELLRESDVLVYTSSTTSIEALAVGVTPLHVSSDCSLEMDPLDFASDLRDEARTPEEMLSTVKSILKREPEEKAEWRRKSREIVKELFAPVTDATYEMFID